MYMAVTFVVRDGLHSISFDRMDGRGVNRLVLTIVTSSGLDCGHALELGLGLD